MVKLVHPIAGLWWYVIPGHTCRKYQVNIPGNMARSAQSRRHLPRRQLAGVVEVLQARVMKLRGDRSRGLLVIFFQHAHPHQAGADWRASSQGIQGLLHRTGAFQAFRSGGRDESQ